MLNQFLVVMLVVLAYNILRRKDNFLPMLPALGKMYFEFQVRFLRLLFLSYLHCPNLQGIKVLW